VAFHEAVFFSEMETVEGWNGKEGSSNGNGNGGEWCLAFFEVASEPPAVLAFLDGGSVDSPCRDSSFINNSVAKACACDFFSVTVVS